MLRARALLKLEVENEETADRIKAGLGSGRTILIRQRAVS